jgi:hypothetical protein
MARTWFWRSALTTLLTAVAVTTGPVALAEVAPHQTSAVHHTAAAAPHTADHMAKSTEKLGKGDPITAEELEAMGPATIGNPLVDGWDVPTDRSYYLESSCSQYSGIIAQGAAAWNNLDQSGGTPVECRSSYITDCGGGGNIVGCNWGSGQRIALFMGGVNDKALLAAHEFGHDWYGHSSYQCAGWGSPAEVMSPTICNFAPGVAKSVPLG